MKMISYIAKFDCYNNEFVHALSAMSSFTHSVLVLRLS